MDEVAVCGFMGLYRGKLGLFCPTGCKYLQNTCKVKKMLRFFNSVFLLVTCKR